MQRDAQGKFALKNDEYRSVRSLRLTDTTWSAMGEMAKSNGITRADYLEQMFRNNNHSCPSNTRSALLLSPSHTRREEASQPSNTRLNEEIERLNAEIARLREENTLLIKRLEELTLVSDLLALRERVLSSLKLGKQAPRYRVVKSALNQFIKLLQHQSPLLSLLKSFQNSLFSPIVDSINPDSQFFSQSRSGIAAIRMNPDTASKSWVTGGFFNLEFPPNPSHSISSESTTFATFKTSQVEFSGNGTVRSASSQLSDGLNNLTRSALPLLDSWAIAATTPSSGSNTS